MKNTLKCTPDNAYLVPKVRLLNCVSNDSFVEEWSIKEKRWLHVFAIILKEIAA